MLNKLKQEVKSYFVAIKAVLGGIYLSLNKLFGIDGSNFSVNQISPFIAVLVSGGSILIVVFTAIGYWYNYFYYQNMHIRMDNMDVQALTITMSGFMYIVHGLLKVFFNQSGLIALTVFMYLFLVYLYRVSRLVYGSIIGVFVLFVVTVAPLHVKNTANADISTMLSTDKLVRSKFIFKKEAIDVISKELIISNDNGELRLLADTKDVYYVAKIGDIKRDVEKINIFQISKDSFWVVCREPVSGNR